MLLTREKRRALIDLLLSTPAATTFAGRTSLLGGDGAASLNRDESNARRDFEAIVDQFELLGARDQLMGLVENALGYAHGTTVGAQLGQVLQSIKDAPKVTKAPSQPWRIFIAYRRLGEEARISQAIRDALTKNGMSVFLDVDMEVGSDWVATIKQHIQQCDFFIVLLSKDAISSEMVQAEVRIAHQTYRRLGAPRILPVRIGYEGPLDYELDYYIGKLQYVIWKDGRDDDHVITSLLSAISPEGKPLEQRPIPPREGEFAPGLDIASHPSPSFTPQLASAPGGAMSARDQLYIERRADREVIAKAALVGQTIVIKGARQRGKSSLLMRYLAACKDGGKRIARIDFQRFSSTDLESYPALLSALAAEIRAALDIDTPDPDIKRLTQMDAFVTRKVLESTEGPVTFAFDEVDRVVGRSYHDDFFGMLRTWHNNRAEGAEWARLDLALVISTEPFLLITNTSQSPFNVVPTTQIDDFTLEECKTLNSRYPTRLSPEEVEELFILLGGHPYLTRVAFYRIIFQSVPFDELMRTAAAPQGPFGDHLRLMLTLVSKDEKLLPVLKKVLGREKLNDTDDRLVPRLISAGLVKQDGDRYKPTNAIYEKFFKGVR